MVRRSREALGALSAILVVGWMGAAAAQNAAPLPSMPMPPSASEPAPKAKAKKPARKRAADQGAVSSGSAASFDRPNRFVPEEFDREGRRGATGGAAPMMSPSGRPGMGMRF